MCALLQCAERGGAKIVKNKIIGANGMRFGRIEPTAWRGGQVPLPVVVIVQPSILDSQNRLVGE